MIDFNYQAVDRTGKVFSGKINAETKKNAINKIKEKGLIPLEILPQSSEGSIRRRSTGRKQKFILYFTQQLANLLNSGVQVDDALTVLIQLTRDQNFRKMIIQIQEEVQGGADLSQALAKHPDLFEESYVNMIRAGESGGVLGLCAQRLAEYIEQDREFRNSIKSSLMYPFIVVSMGLLAVVLLFVFVVPRFITLFNSLETSLPLPTQILLSLSSGIMEYWYLIIVTIFLILLGYFYYLNTPRGRYKIDEFKNRLPIIGQIRINLTVSRFTKILGTMMGSGVPLLKGLEIAKNTLNNQVFIHLVDNLYEYVRKGGTMVGFLENEPEFPELAVFLIGVGERTGNLEEMLNKVADTLANEVKRSLQAVLTAFEPVVVLLLGLFVFFIVISILLPIFSLQQLPL